MLAAPVLRELRPDLDSDRRVGLVSVVHDAAFCALHVTERGGLDDPGNTESWMIRDVTTGIELAPRGGGGGGGVSGDPARAFHRYCWVFDCPRLPSALGVSTESGSVDEVVALEPAGRIVGPRFVAAAPARLSRDELELLMSSGVFRDSLPSSMATLSAEPLITSRGRLDPLIVEAWRGAEKIWFRVTDYTDDPFGAPSDDPWSDLGIVLVEPDGTQRRGMWSGRVGADGVWLSITYPATTIQPA